LGGAEGTVVVRSFRQKNYGAKYDGWQHPHSPYYTDKKAGKLPYHPQPGGATYRDWLTWLVSPEDKTTETAAVIRAWGGRVKRLRFTDNGADVWQSGVLACGFDMDNMKARGWLEARIPYFDAPRDVEDMNRWRALFFGTANRLVAGAQEAGSTLRYRVRLAKFGSCDRATGSYSLPKTSPGKKAFEDLYEAFWRETEPDFRAALVNLRDSPADETMTVREEFLRALRVKALHLFDETAGTDELAEQDARRIVEARAGLGFAFGPTGEVRGNLGILTAEAQQKAAKRRNANKKEAAA
jgi:CRISPR system Cascade subunit CasA